MSSGGSQSGHLVRVRTANGTKTISLTKDEFIIGRDTHSDIRIDLFEVSRKHAMIQIVDGKAYVQDMGSGNGTSVIGKGLTPGVRVPLNSTEVEICIGDVAWITVVPSKEQRVELEPMSSMQALFQERDSDPAPEPAPGKPEMTGSVSLAMARIEAIQNEAVRMAEAIEAEAREHARQLVDEAQQKIDDELRGKYAEMDVLRARAERMTGEVDNLTSAVEALTLKKEEVEATCSQAESRQRQAEDIVLRLEARREEMEAAAVQASTNLTAARQESETLDRKTQQFSQLITTSEKTVAELSEKIVVRKQELIALETKIKNETELFDNEKRRSSSLLEALQAEHRAKKANIEAAIGEVELKQISAKTRLQEILSEARTVELEIARKTSDCERSVSQAQETLAALKKESEAVSLSLIEKNREIVSSDTEIGKRKAQIELLTDEVTAAEKRFAQLNEEIEKIRQEAVTKIDLDRKEAEKKIELDLKEAMFKLEAERKEAMAKLEFDRQETKKSFDTEIQARRTQLEDSFVERATEMKREIADAKLKELEKIQGLQEEANKKDQERRAFIFEEIIRSAVAFKSDSVDEVGLRKAIQDALAGKSAGGLSADAARRSRKFWIKIGTYAAVPTAAALVLYLFPGITQSMKSGVDRTIASEKNNSGGAFLEKIKQNGEKYAPPQDRVYRNTYADNVLYLEHYAEMKLDDQEKKRWTLLLNDFIVGRLGLGDRVIPDVVAAESVMVQELSQLGGQIIPQFKEHGLAGMAEAEKQGIVGLMKGLQTPENYQKFRAFEKSYYEDYLKRRTK